MPIHKMYCVARDPRARLDIRQEKLSQCEGAVAHEHHTNPEDLVISCTNDCKGRVGLNEYNRNLLNSIIRRMGDFTEADYAIEIFSIGNVILGQLQELTINLAEGKE